MDYLYLNAIVKETYLDLPSGFAFPQKYRDYLRTYSTNDECLKSGAPGKILTYFTIKEGEHPPVSVLCSTQKHLGTVSVGRFSQCVGWEWDNKLVADNMDTIFGVGFYTEQELTDGAMKGEKFALPRSRRLEFDRIPIALNEETKKAILTAVMVRWLRHEPILKIAVPGNVDYNNYVLSAVEQIYALFPVALRAEAGFSSYLPKNADNLDRIYIGFIPEAQADSTTLFLDGSSKAVLTALNKGTRRPALDLFIKYLSCAKPDQVRGFLQEVFADVEGSGDGAAISAVSAREYAVVGEVLNLLTLSGGADVLVPAWQAFYANPGKYSPNMQNQIRRHIAGTADPAAIAAYFRSQCETARNPAQIFDILLTFKNICGDAAAVSGMLWDAAVEIMQGKGISFEKIHLGASAKKNDLAPILNDERLAALYVLSLSEQFAVLKAKELVSLTKIDQAKAQVAQWQSDAGSSEAAASLQADLAAFSAGLDAQRIALVLAQLRNRLAEILAKPAVSMTALKKQLTDLQALLTDIDKQSEAASFAELRSDVARLIEEKNQLVNSSSTRIRQIEDIIDGSNDYFLILEKLEHISTDGLDPLQLKQTEETLANKRPGSTTAYKSAFQDHYRKELLLANLCELSDYLCKQIIRDICAINCVTVPYASGKNRADNLTEISGARMVAKKISRNCSVKVAFDGKDHPESWFRRTLELTHTRETAGDFREFSKIFSALVSAGAYTGSDMAKAVKMFRACRFKIAPVFTLILQGRFRDATEDQYQEVYQAILDALANDGSETALEDMNSLFTRTENKDKTAARAFTAFMQKQSGGKKKLLIPLIAGAAVLVALIAGVILFFVLRNKEPEVPVTEPPVTVPATEYIPTPEEIYPVLFQHAAKYGTVFADLHAASADLNFDAYASRVFVSLSAEDISEETRSAIISEYLASQPVPVEGATWNEFVFWVCWLHADNVDAIPDAIAELDADALSILTFIHAFQLPPENSDTAFDPDPTEATGAGASEPTDVTEATGAPATEAPTEAPTEVPTEAPTEPPMPTLSEILGMIYTDAYDAFRLDPAGFARLAQVQTVFGTAFDKSFDDHIAAVEKLLTSGKDKQNQAMQEMVMKHYRTLPGDTVIRFSGSGMAITWNEFVFWECWILAQNPPAEFSDAVFNDDLRADTLEILDLIYNLSEGTATFPAPETPATEPTNPETEGDGETGETGEPTEPDLLTAIGLMDAAAQAGAAYEAAATAYQSILLEFAPVG